MSSENLQTSVSAAEAVDEFQAPVPPVRLWGPLYPSTDTDAVVKGMKTGNSLRVKTDQSSHDVCVIEERPKKEGKIALDLRSQTTFMTIVRSVRLVVANILSLISR